LLVCSTPRLSKNKKHKHTKPKKKKKQKPPKNTPPQKQPKTKIWVVVGGWFFPFFSLSVLEIVAFNYF